MKKALLLFVFGICSLNPGISKADSSVDLSEHLLSKVTSTNDAFLNAVSSSEEDKTQVDSIELKQFFLTLTATASFGMSKVVDLQVSPEITFIWETVETD